MNKNEDSTRFYSDKMEKSVAKALDGFQTSNSGAGRWRKGDVHIPNKMLVECKTCMKDKQSFSIKEEWITKNKEEAFTQRLPYTCIAFSFGPNKPNYYVIDEHLMQQLIEELV